MNKKDKIRLEKLMAQNGEVYNQIKCEWCGTMFKKKQGRSKFCCHYCYQQHKLVKERDYSQMRRNEGRIDKKIIVELKKEIDYSEAIKKSPDLSKLIAVPIPGQRMVIYVKCAEDIQNAIETVANRKPHSYSFGRMAINEKSWQRAKRKKARDYSREKAKRIKENTITTT